MMLEDSVIKSQKVCATNETRLLDILEHYSDRRLSIRSRRSGAYWKTATQPNFCAFGSHRGFREKEIRRGSCNTVVDVIC